MKIQRKDLKGVNANHNTEDDALCQFSKNLNYSMGFQYLWARFKYLM